MGDLSKVFSKLVMVSQLGLSLIMPLLICMLLGWYINSRFGVGAWVFIPAFLLGMGGSISTGYRMYQSIMRKLKKEDKKSVSFNKHL